MNKDELDLILEKHKKWLNNEEDGERANLSKANLRCIKLKEVDLRGAVLFGADLTYADLQGANLYGADLGKAQLHFTDLRNTNLRRANLRGANLSRAYLCDADLRETYLFMADLCGAYLDGADLTGANLDRSCLSLSCGSLDAQFDDKQLAQIAYHLCKAGLNSKNASDATKKELRKLVDFANQFHRVDECGKIKILTNRKEEDDE